MAIGPDKLGLMLGAAGVVIFGATLPALKFATPELGVGFLTAGRAAGAGLLGLLVLVALRRTIPDRTTLGALFMASLGIVWGFPLLSAFAMTRASSAHGGVVIAVLPLATALAGAWLSGDRPSGRFWTFATLGAALVLAFALLRGDAGAVGIGIGDVALLAAVPCAAIGYALSGRVARQMPGWEVISWAVALALPVALPAAYLTAPPAPAAIGASAWWGFAYVTVMAQYVGFSVWNAGLALGGVARVSQVQLLQPFVTLLFAALLLSEPIDGATIAFAAAVVAVVAVGRRAPVARRA